MTAMLTLFQQLDNFRSLGTFDSFYGHIPHQFVQPMQFSYEDHADLVPTVTYKGMGRDIWTVPFENITAILKVWDA
jgi:hypothetical protein